MSSQSVLQRYEKECRNLARSHYENFIVASVLLPRRLRQPFYNVYAFCRTADDLADESPSPQIALHELDSLQEQLDATFAGNPPENLFTALADTIEQFDLPKQPFDDLLSAFRQDQSVTRYPTFDAVHDYCQRSANPVGRIVLQLAGAVDAENVALSDSICTGLQLVNFWQDVARDYAIDRIYLPRETMDAFAVDEAMFSERSTSAELRRAIHQQCDLAERFLRRGLPLAQRVPRWFASDVKLFAHGGLATVKAIRQIDYDVLRVRPKVGKFKQVALIARAMTGLL